MTITQDGGAVADTSQGRGRDRRWRILPSRPSSTGGDRESRRAACTPIPADEPDARVGDGFSRGINHPAWRVYAWGILTSSRTGSPAPTANGGNRSPACGTGLKPEAAHRAHLPRRHRNGCDAVRGNAGDGKDACVYSGNSAAGDGVDHAPLHDLCGGRGRRQYPDHQHRAPHANKHTSRGGEGLLE